MRKKIYRYKLLNGSTFMDFKTFSNPDNLSREAFTEALQRDTMLPSKYRKFKEKSFSSAVAAIMVARELGYTVNNENEVLSA